MENNDIISRLLADSEWEKIVNIKTEENEVISTARVVSIKYKVYAVILMLFFVIFLMNFVLPALDKLSASRLNYQQKTIQIASSDNNKIQYEKDKSLIEMIASNESQVVACLNLKSWCKALNEQLKNNFSFVRSYLQLNNLYDSKMQINEKLLLVNINEYLLKTDKSKNWQINSISFGESETVLSQLYSIPVKLTVSFDTKDDLLSFVDNVDTKILENKSYRILYKIDQIAYDIMNYNQEQTVDILMHAFYYKE